ncbi:hypothetical protein RYX36_009468, partial [Vicia faba]
AASSAQKKVITEALVLDNILSSSSPRLKSPSIRRPKDGLEHLPPSNCSQPSFSTPKPTKLSPTTLPHRKNRRQYSLRLRTTAPSPAPLASGDTPFVGVLQLRPPSTSSILQFSNSPILEAASSAQKKVITEALVLDNILSSSSPRLKSPSIRRPKDGL